MESFKHVVVGTAGHIDHGKSSLVQTLTGTDPDRLQEEKRRGITIDLGFAFLDLPGVRIGFVDVPGHERFVRNMLAGVGGIDFVILVVAADESIKPQTREHFDICRLLGIQRGIVAITKSDLVDADSLSTVRREIVEFVRGSFLQDAEIIPLSVRSGAGLDALNTELQRLGAAAAPRDANAHVRLPVDRAFAMKGFGTVVTGTLISGSLRPEDELELYPTSERVRVRGLHSGGNKLDRATAGQRTAVNLTGVDLASIERGMVLAPPGMFVGSDRIDVQITLLPGARALKQRARVHFHQGTVERIAEINFVDAANDLSPGQSAFAQLRLDQPVLVLPSDRFILRQLSPVVTIGGGAVLDVRPARRKRRDAAIRPFLDTLTGGNKQEILAALLSSIPRELSMRDAIARTGWTSAEVLEAAIGLTASNRARVLAEHPWAIAAASTVAEYAALVLKVVDAFHIANPLLPGIPKQDLRVRAGNPGALVFDAALTDLLQSAAISNAGDVIRRANREVYLSADESRAKDAIESEFRAAALAPPDLEAVLKTLKLDRPRAEKLAQMLFREKALVRISNEIVLHASAIKHLNGLVAAYKKSHGTHLSVAAFKELTGASRKYAIPLLEHLDRERVTRRAGDERVIL